MRTSYKISNNLRAVNLRFDFMRVWLFARINLFVKDTKNSFGIVLSLTD